MTHSDLEILIHSQVCEAVGNACKLYYLCRAIDKKGSGRVVIDRRDILQTLDISLSTFYRYIQNTKLFHTVIRDGNSYTIHYSSLIKVAISYGIEKLGGCGYILVEDLKEWRENSTLLEALDLQKQSIYAARAGAKYDKRERRGGCAKPTVDFQTIIETVERKKFKGTSDIALGVLLKDRVLYIDGDSYAPFGGSQTTIGNKLGRCTRTVIRRLKNAPKLYQAIGKQEYEHDYSLRWIDEKDLHNNLNKLFIKNFPQMPVNTYKSYTNLYMPVITMTKKSFLRYKLDAQWGYINSQSVIADGWNDQKPNDSLLSSDLSLGEELF